MKITLDFTDEQTAVIEEINQRSNANGVVPSTEEFALSMLSDFAAIAILNEKKSRFEDARQRLEKVALKADPSDVAAIEALAAKLESA